MTIHRISNIRNTIRIEIRDHDNQERAACAIAVAYYIEMNITTKYHLALLYLYFRYIHFQLVLFSFLSRTYEELREREEECTSNISWTAHLLVVVCCAISNIHGYDTSYFYYYRPSLKV